MSSSTTPPTPLMDDEPQLDGAEKIGETMKSDVVDPVDVQCGASPREDEVEVIAWEDTPGATSVYLSQLPTVFEIVVTRIIDSDVNFEVHVSHNGKSWKVIRTIKQFEGFFERARTMKETVPTVSVDGATVETLQQGTLAILSAFGEDIMQKYDLLMFLDDHFGKSQISNLFCTQCFAKLGALEHELSNAKSDMLRMNELLLGLVAKVELSPSLECRDDGKVTAAPAIVPFNRKAEVKSTAAVQRALSDDWAGSSDVTEDTGVSSRARGPRPKPSMVAFNGLVSPELTLSDDEASDYTRGLKPNRVERFANLSGIRAATVKVPSGEMPITLPGDDNDPTQTKAVDGEEVSDDVEEQRVATAVCVDDADLRYMNCQYLPGAIIPVNEEPSALEKVSDDLILILEPHKQQMEYRASMRHILTRNISRSIDAKVFETSLSALRCFLPDDGVKLSLAMWKNNIANWNVSVSEALTRMLDGQKDVEEPDEEVRLVQEFGEVSQPVILAEHQPTNVSSSTMGNNITISVTLGPMAFEIDCLPAKDLSLIALLEDISVVVGKNNLFKKSLLLIRAWWVYETTSYIGCPMKHYLSDFSMAVMVSAIFNQYHHKIHFPIQALCVFLAEYSDFDWSNYVITLQGIVAFREDSDQPALIDPKGHELLGLELVRKYIQRDPKTLTLCQQNTDPCSASSSINGTSVQRPSATMSTETGGDDDRSVRSTIIPAEDMLLATHFERRAVNILDPLNYCNMVNEKLNHRRAKRIVKVFQMGAQNLNSAMVLAAGRSVSVHTPFYGFYRSVLNRFGSGWRPDVVGNMLQAEIGLNEKHVYALVMEHLTNIISYVNLQMGIVSEPGLLIICKEILFERGTLPVGEIGKMLQELTGISNLSNKLKEKFGGLKKFLERSAQQFVISTDHPFNPHVFLRKDLSQEDLEVIKRGIVPPQITAKFKKIPAPGAKKQKEKAATQPTRTPEMGSWISRTNSNGSRSHGPSPQASTGMPSLPNNVQASALSPASSVTLAQMMQSSQQHIAAQMRNNMSNSNQMHANASRQHKMRENAQFGNSFGSLDRGFAGGTAAGNARRVDQFHAYGANAKGGVAGNAIGRSQLQHAEMLDRSPNSNAGGLGGSGPAVYNMHKGGVAMLPSNSNRGTHPANMTTADRYTQAAMQQERLRAQQMRNQANALDLNGPVGPLGGGLLAGSQGSPDSLTGDWSFNGLSGAPSGGGMIGIDVSGDAMAGLNSLGGYDDMLREHNLMSSLGGLSGSGRKGHNSSGILSGNVGGRGGFLDEDALLSSLSPLATASNDRLTNLQFGSSTSNGSFDQSTIGMDGDFALAAKRQMQQQEMQLRQMQQQQQQQQQQQRGQSAHNALGVPGHSGEGFDVSGSGSLLGNFNTDTNLQALGISRTGEEMPPSGMVSQNQFNYLGNNF